jgi:putative methionine-R-sulfoxide reductase with GAF domain
MESPATQPAESDPGWKPVFGERRRHVRQRVHAPAYASLDTNSSGIVLDLNEVLDISEQGMDIQTASPPEIKSSLNLSLDLSETKTFLHTTGEVIWADRSGRAGIRFPNMPYASVRQLKEWLFLNAITACSNHLAIPASRLRPEVMHTEPVLPPSPENPEAPLSPDYSAILGALAAVQREAESVGSDLEVALRLIAGRAQAFTRASGSAIALQQGSEMVCRASAGDAPPVGAVLQAGSGFSGECVRAGRLLRCDDSETDPLVDRESCRALGIRSMIAIPIRANGGVAGLLEVFSPKPHAFADNDNIVVRRLAETTASAIRRADSDRNSPATSTNVSSDPLLLETESETEQQLGARSPSIRSIVVVSCVAVLVVWFTWLLLSMFKSGKKPDGPQRLATPQAVVKPAAASARPSGFEALRSLAERGDPAAQFAVGAHYVTGEEVVQDYSEAVRWFSLAAEHGHVTAQSTLGAYYGIGRGVTQDFAKAYFWSILAQAGGDEASKYRIPLLVSHLNRPQIVAIQQEANDWLKQHQIASSKPSPAR